MMYRIFGFFALSVGWILAKYSVFEPLAAMSSNSSEIKIGTFSIILIPLCIATGCAFLLLGKRSQGLFFSEDEQSFSSFGVIALVALLLCGVPLKMWVNSKVETSGYDPRVYKSDVTLSEPLAIQFNSDAIEITDARTKKYKITWAELGEINIKAIPDSKGQNYQIYWEFVDKKNLWVAVPLGAVEERKILDEIRDHAGPIQHDPVNDIKKTIAKSTYSAIWNQVVWRKD